MYCNSMYILLARVCVAGRAFVGRAYVVVVAVVVVVGFGVESASAFGAVALIVGANGAVVDGCVAEDVESADVGGVACVGVVVVVVVAVAVAVDVVGAKCVSCDEESEFVGEFVGGFVGGSVGGSVAGVVACIVATADVVGVLVVVGFDAVVVEFVAAVAESVADGRRYVDLWNLVGG
jgi:hypothetical protein